MRLADLAADWQRFCGELVVDCLLIGGGLWWRGLA